VEKKTVYVETSIASYLTARPTNELLAAAWQKATIDWLDAQSGRFCLFPVDRRHQVPSSPSVYSRFRGRPGGLRGYTSSIVMEEAARGHQEAASRRLEALFGIPLLAITEAVVVLSKALIQEGALPSKALDDSLHIAVAAVHGIDYLLTWNCSHIANAEIKSVIRKVCASHSYISPEICTPHELMGVDDND